MRHQFLLLVYINIYIYVYIYIHSLSQTQATGQKSSSLSPSSTYHNPLSGDVRRSKGKVGGDGGKERGTKGSSSYSAGPDRVFRSRNGRDRCDHVTTFPDDNGISSLAPIRCSRGSLTAGWAGSELIAITPVCWQLEASYASRAWLVGSSISMAWKRRYYIHVVVLPRSI